MKVIALTKKGFSIARVGSASNYGGPRLFVEFLQKAFAWFFTKDMGRYGPAIPNCEGALSITLDYLYSR